MFTEESFLEEVASELEWQEFFIGRHGKWYFRQDWPECLKAQG